jgi:hypothetical protein
MDKEKHRQSYNLLGSIKKKDYSVSPHNLSHRVESKMIIKVNSSFDVENNMHSNSGVLAKISDKSTLKYSNLASLKPPNVNEMPAKKSYSSRTTKNHTQSTQLQLHEHMASTRMIPEGGTQLSLGHPVQYPSPIQNHSQPAANPSGRRVTGQPNRSTERHPSVGQEESETCKYFLQSRVSRHHRGQRSVGDRQPTDSLCETASLPLGKHYTTRSGGDADIPPHTIPPRDDTEHTEHPAFHLDCKVMVGEAEEWLKKISGGRFFLNHRRSTENLS